MLTGALTYDINNPNRINLEGYDLARNIIRLLEELDKKQDSKGRKCYNAKIKDLVLTSVDAVKNDIDANPEHVYLIAHGGIEVNGKLWPYRTYIWNKKDKVVEGLDIAHNGKITPLSAFGPNLKASNVFGCYISPRVRRTKVPGTLWTYQSSPDTFNAMFRALYNRLLRYKDATDCKCETDIFVYEGERTSISGLTTDDALERFPPQPEDYYKRESTQ